jgi:hypothetical protein
MFEVDLCYPDLYIYFESLIFANSTFKLIIGIILTFLLNFKLGKNFIFGYELIFIFLDC